MGFLQKLFGAKDKDPQRDDETTKPEELSFSAVLDEVEEAVTTIQTHVQETVYPPEPVPEPASEAPEAPPVPETPPAPPPAPVLPDTPRPFGQKMCWLVVKSDSPDAVAEALGLEKSRPANWETGLAGAYTYNSMFVSPCLGGQVLAIGMLDPEANRDWMLEFAGHFPQVQFFGTHRVSEYHSWAKYENGQLTRAYFYLGESRQVRWEEGMMTREETLLGFGGFPHGEDVDWDRVRIPGEEDVLTLAAAWGMDPQFRNQSYPAGLGWLCDY